MNGDVEEAIGDLQRRLLWSKRLRAVSIFLFIAPIIAMIAILVTAVVADRKGPEAGFFTIATIFYALVWAPILLIPLVTWIVLARRCRILQERLDSLPELSEIP